MNTPDTFTHLFWAYNAIWALIVVFLFLLAGRLRRQHRQIQALQQELSGK